MGTLCGHLEDSTDRADEHIATGSDWNAHENALGKMDLEHRHQLIGLGLPMLIAIECAKWDYDKVTGSILGSTFTSGPIPEAVQTDSLATAKLTCRQPTPAPLGNNGESFSFGPWSIQRRTNRLLQFQPPSRRRLNLLRTLDQAHLE